MPKVNASNGIRPEIRALAVMKLGVPVTPSEIDAYVGTGSYAAKYVSFLNTRYGFKISSQKDGRRVVSYTVDAEPDNVEDLRSAQPKQSKKVAEVPEKEPAPTPTKTPAGKKGGSKKSSKSKAKAKPAKPVDEVEEQFGTTGEVGGIDGDWDNMEGLDLSKLL